MTFILPTRFQIMRRCLCPSTLLTSYQRPLFITRNCSDYRTSKTNPANHKLSDVGKFYTIPKEEGLEKIFRFGGWPTSFRQQCEALHDSSLMIRKPGLEIIHYLTNADYSLPINKYVLYGRHGNGKSLLLSYIIHYGILNGWLVVHLPYFIRWITFPKEISHQEDNAEFVDLNARATEWLMHFKLQNLKMLTENELRVENAYVWNIRESSNVGDKLLQLVEYGIARGAFSSKVVMAILEEIKILSKLEKVKTLLCIDGFNAFYHSKRQIKDENRNYYLPKNVSILAKFFEMTTADWHNGAAILTVDEIAENSYNQQRLPLQLLDLEGFEHLFPFVPIEVPPFTDVEFYNMLKYYKERRWLRPSGGEEELKYLSCKNGYELMKICSGLY